MKLNIGCGKKYEPNYYNIDLYENLVADKLMSAINLELEENVSVEVKAIHLVEHLSYFETIYALSEFFRVLKPNGLLILEIPDIEKACQLYIKADDDQKKEILGWIYGIPHKGLQHKFCFPINFLIETLKNIGFKNITTEYYFNNESIPSIRINSIKLLNENSLKIFQTIAKLRKEMICENYIDFKDSFTTKEKEDLIGIIRLKSFQQKPDSKKKNVIEILIKLLIKSPKIAKLYLDILDKKNLFSNLEENYLYNTIESLVRLNFPNILYQAIKKLSISPGTQKIAYFSIESYAKSIIKKLLVPIQERDEILKKLESRFGAMKNLDFDFFSYNTLQQNSLNFFYKGIKSFHNSYYKEAFKNFLEAIRLYRDDYLYYWNLARVLIKLNRRQEALKFYKWTKRLVRISRIKNKEIIFQNLKKEIKSIPSKEEITPINDSNIKID